MNTMRIGDILVSKGLITEQQLGEAIGFQKLSGTEKRLGEILIEKEFVTEDQLLGVLSSQLGIPMITITNEPVQVSSVARIPKRMAIKYNAIAISEAGGALNVVMSDPLDFYALEDIKLIVNMPINKLISHKAEIQTAIQYWYSEIDAKNAAQSANIAMGESVTEMEDLSGSPDDTPVVALVNSILQKAHNAGASDIHIEPFDDKTVVRIRVDGQIMEFLTLSKGLHNSMLTRIKILSSLNIAEKRVPQDGHFRALQNNVELNVRVSILPTIFGEKVVLRFLSRNIAIDNAATFGMSEENAGKLVNILRRPHGIVYVTGPTGSGKTSTLYMILEYLSKNELNISTIEDPVEKALPKINQTQTNVLAGLTFENGLRSLLRQDPDIIMVGETRDSETASIAVSAALTGHLVLSSMHTNDAVSAIARLLDIGIEPYMIANSLTGVVAQRLVRKICPICRTPYEAGEADHAVLGGVCKTLYKGRGCPACNNTGYKGRIAIHEILSIDSTVAALISRKEPIDKIYEYLAQKGLLKTLRDNMRDLVLSGQSTIEEMLRLVAFS